MSAGTVGEALEASRDALRAAGVDSPALDAELLLVAATATDRSTLLASPDAAVEAPQARRFGELVRRRVQREPVAYILGRKGFRLLDLSVDPRVLIPRPETELLVEVALELGPATVLDVGTGSGAVALAVAAELPGVRVWGTDTSPPALEVAGANAERLGLERRVSFSEPDRAVDLILANLPYVAEEEWEGLAPEITRYEPRQALVGGPTGLEVIDELLGRIATGDLETTAIALEVGAGQAATVAEIARRAGFESVGTRADLAGIDRVVVGTR